MKNESSLISLKSRLLARSYIKDNCIVWNGCINERGYGIINFNNRAVLAHRASWFIHNGSFPKQLVLHTCDVRNCINIDHLKEGTCQDNTDDMMRKNRYKMPTHYNGSKNANSILNEELVFQIKSSLINGKSVAEVARIFQQPFSRIYDIKRQRTWKHIMSDAFSINTYKFIPAKGERSSSAKLTNTQVIDIKKLLKTGMPNTEIAAKFNISNNQISCIKNGKYWSHLKE
jgi:hypothetical protein